MLLNLRNYGTFAGNFPAFVASARASLQYPRFVVLYLSCLLSKHLVAEQTVWRIRLVVYGARLESVLV